MHIDNVIAGNDDWQLGESRPCTKCEGGEICKKKVYTYADNTTDKNLQGRGAIIRGIYCTGTATTRLDIQESKSFSCGPPDSGGLAGGESTDSGGEG